jgi:hypothetical protein
VNSLVHILLTLVLPPAFVLSASGAASAQAIDENLWVTDGTTRSVVRAGGTIYIGGAFTQVGPAGGGGVPINVASGALLGSFPKVAGRVFEVVPDGAGGWYIGGQFTAVGGVPRSNLAHVASDMSVSAWNPSVNADGRVLAIAVSGSTVYADGYFTSIDGQPPTHLPGAAAAVRSGNR